MLRYSSLLQARDVLAETIRTGDAVLRRNLVVWGKETVMDLLMEVPMMVMRGVRENWCVAVTTVSSLVHTTIQRTIVAIIQRHWQFKTSFLTLNLGLPLSLLQVRDAEVVILTARDVALQRIRVMKEKETVTDQEMEDNMMDTEGVREILCVDPTIVFNLELTSIPRMTAVRGHSAPLSASQTVATFPTPPVCFPSFIME